MFNFFMNKVVITLLLLTLAFSFNLKVGSTVTLTQSYQLHCEGAQGRVQYQADNLPKGVRLQGDKLEVYDKQSVQEGYHTVRVSARDQHGQFDQTLIVVIIKKPAAVQAEAQPQIRNEVRQQQRTSQVNEILDGLLVPSSIETNYDYPNAGYPTGNMPTGYNREVRNYVPHKITTKQATRSESNRNEITSEDVRGQAIFQRQLNAAKALANLLSIVKQATANRNAAKVEIEKRTNIFNKANEAKREAEANVITAENDLARINKGIETTNVKINGIRKEIEELVSLQEKKNLERDSLIEGIGKAKLNLKDVEAQLRTEREHLVEAEIDLADKGAECEGLAEEVKNVEGELKDRNLEKASLGIEIKAAAKTVDEDEAAVAELKKQLAAAEGVLQASRNKLKELNEEARKLNELIRSIEARLKDLRGRVEKCKAELAAIQARVDQLKNKIIPALEVKKLQIETEIKRLNEKVAAINAELEQIPNQIAELEAQLPKLLESLRVLRSQVFIYETRLRAAYQAGNAANEKVALAKENLDAANKRYIDEDNIIKEATRNIELARVEKAKADQAVEDYLREGVDILPFAAAPGESGFESMGGGQFAIKSWKEYVEVAYGKGVKPLFVGDLQSLYSFLPVEEEAEAEVEEGGCEVERQKAISGYVIQVKPASMVMINDEGAEFEITYSKCTKALANKEGYNLSPGDIALVKGEKAEGRNKIRATQLTCIRR